MSEIKGGVGPTSRVLSEDSPVVLLLQGDSLHGQQSLPPGTVVESHQQLERGGENWIGAWTKILFT